LQILVRSNYYSLFYTPRPALLPPESCPESADGECCRIKF
jgi:hypothetical protein